MHIIAAILFVEDLAISRHEHGYGVGKKKHTSGGSARETVGAGKAHSGILQVHRVHQVVQRHMGIATT
jgi:hypothetical protein